MVYKSSNRLSPLKRKRPISRQAGFTLVELLVVIAIIAILASLLLTGLSRAKQMADNAVCRNNLRQIGIGLSLYVADFSAYPAYQTAPFSLPNSPGVLYAKLWAQFLEPYAGSKWPKDNYKGKLIANSAGRGVFACPGYNKVKGVYGTFSQGLCGAYAYNTGSGNQNIYSGGVITRVQLLGLSTPFLRSSAGILTDPITVKESQVASPAQMIAVSDSEIDVADGMPSDAIVGRDSLPPLLSPLLVNRKRPMNPIYCGGGRNANTGGGEGWVNWPLALRGVLSSGPA
jgi:prepilin-type N-terminal cleavage/methylation domain-containing protein